MGTRIPFTRRVAEYRMPEKFKSPSDPELCWDEDPSNEVACQAFPLTLTRDARDWFKRLLQGSIDTFEEQ